MAKVYRSARGKIVDMEKLAQANSGVAAVTGGSQNVNARGDELGDGGRIIRTREEVMAAYNANRKTNVTPDVQPDPIAIETPPVDTGDPFDPVADAARTDEFAVMDDEFGPMVSVAEQKAAQDAEKARQEEMMTRTAEMRAKRAAEVEAAGAGIDVDTNVGVAPMAAPVDIEADVIKFVDDVTGKEYKTERALKTAITKRENAANKEGGSDATWAD